MELINEEGNSEIKEYIQKWYDLKQYNEIDTELKVKLTKIYDKLIKIGRYVDDFVLNMKDNVKYERKLKWYNNATVNETNDETWITIPKGTLLFHGTPRIINDDYIMQKSEPLKNVWSDIFNTIIFDEAYFADPYIAINYAFCWVGTELHPNAYSDTGRVLSFKTKHDLKLLSLDSWNTFDHLYRIYGQDFNNYLFQQGFGFDPDNREHTLSRYSNIDIDQQIMDFICSKGYNGYAYSNLSAPEVMICNVSDHLSRSSLEYRYVFQCPIVPSLVLVDNGVIIEKISYLNVSCIDNITSLYPYNRNSLFDKFYYTDLPISKSFY